MRGLFLAGALVVIGLTGCSTMPTGDSRHLANKNVDTSKIVCRDVKPTGSHRSRTVCLSQRQREQTSREAADWVRTGGQLGAVHEVKP